MDIPSPEDLAAQIAALRKDLEEFRQTVNRDTEFSGLSADHLERRVEALEETVVRRWPARRFATARLRRSVRASMRHIADPGPTWRTRREQAVHVEFHVSLDEAEQKRAQGGS